MLPGIAARAGLAGDMKTLNLPLVPGNGFHWVEFVVGMLLGLAALASFALLAKRATGRHWQRRQTAVVMDALKDLKREDVERLLKEVRYASNLAAPFDKLTLHPCSTSYAHPAPALAALPAVVIYALKDLERMNVVRHRRSAMKFADCLC